MRTGVLVAIAAGLIVIGGLLGLVPGSAQGAAGEFSCGSPWIRDSAAVRSQTGIDELGDALGGSRARSSNYSARCDDALDARGVLGVVLAGLGALALVGVAVVRRPEASAAQSGE